MKKRGNKAKHRRNNGGGSGAPPRRPRIGQRIGQRIRARLPRRAEPPPFWSIVTTVGASAGTAVLSGLAVNHGVAKPVTVAATMIGVGLAGAYFGGGHVREAFTSIASVGAGQLALAGLAGAALKGSDSSQSPPKIASAAPPQLPAPASDATSRRAQSATGGDYVADVYRYGAANDNSAGYGGGSVVDLFRDAANDLDRIEEDEWRYGTRDVDDAGDFVDVDLDDAA